VWYDVFRPGPRAVLPERELPLPGPPEAVTADGTSPPRKFLPQPFETMEANPQVIARVLHKLKPGMTRTEVEGLVGRPAPHDVHPATVADGRVTYRACYEADLEPPSTVRPIRPTRPVVARPADRTLVTLEFDATKPGHPLIEVHYPDPLF
jgi:hypothetical protein